jgi:hypothetical protein
MSGNMGIRAAAMSNSTAAQFWNTSAIETSCEKMLWVNMRHPQSHASGHQQREQKEDVVAIWLGRGDLAIDGHGHQTDGSAQEVV